MKTDLTNDDIVDLGLLFQDQWVDIEAIVQKAKSGTPLSLSEQVLLKQQELLPTQRIETKKLNTDDINIVHSDSYNREEAIIRAQLNKEIGGGFDKVDDLELDAFETPDTANEDLFLEEAPGVVQQSQSLGPLSNVAPEPRLYLPQHPKKQKLSKAAKIGIVIGSIGTLAVIATAVALIILLVKKG